MSRTGFGISICRSPLTSWPISAIGKRGERSSGPTGWPVPGCRTGGGGDGRSAMMLYQAWGIRSSPMRYLLCSLNCSSLRRACWPPRRVEVNAVTQRLAGVERLSFAAGVAAPSRNSPAKRGCWAATGGSANSLQTALFARALAGPGRIASPAQVESPVSTPAFATLAPRSRATSITSAPSSGRR